MTLPTYSQAVDAASAHRGHAGDDVVLHDYEDYDGYLVCQDCCWGLSYQPELDDEMDDDDE